MVSQVTNPKNNIIEKTNTHATNEMPLLEGYDPEAHIA